MSTVSPSMIRAMNAAQAAAAPRHGRPGWVLTLLPLIWVLNLLDLLFTLLAGTTRGFIELNPLAAHLGAPGQVVFKLAMLTLCTVVFVALRRRRSVLWGCYLLLAVYGALAGIWVTMFPFLLSPIYLRQLAGLF